MYTSEFSALVITFFQKCFLQIRANIYIKIDIPLEKVQREITINVLLCSENSFEDLAQHSAT